MNDAAPDSPRRFSVFHALYLSFHSKEFYQDVGRNWTGIGFAYLFFLLAVAWVPPMLQLHLGVQKWVRDYGPRLVVQLPRIQITNGQVQTDPPGRHEIKDPESGKTFFIIDPGIESIALDEFGNDIAILTRNKLVVKQSDQSQTRIQDLAGIKNFLMTRDDASRWMRICAQWFAAVFYPFALLFSFLYRILQALFYAAIGLAFAQAAKATLNYATLLRLAAVAVTPAVLVDTLHDFVHIQIPLWWLICFLIAMFYLHLAVSAAAEAQAAPSAGAPPTIS